MLRGHRRRCTSTACAAAIRSSSRAATAAGSTLARTSPRSLAAKGFFVVGFDAKAYLESFTSAWSYAAARGRARRLPRPGRLRGARPARRPILIGVSEGAGLSVLAATDPLTKPRSPASIGLGLPDLNELGWRWRDALIYVTHGMPNEPTFSAATIVEQGRAGAACRDPFHARRVRARSRSPAQLIEQAGEPKRLWIVNASNHRFSDNLDGVRSDACSRRSRG